MECNTGSNSKLQRRKVIGLIAGGPRALIKAKEGFEDSEKAGAEALIPFKLSSKDVVILISASASAKFNIGAGKLALNKEASVFYFYNTEQIPSYSQQFMSNLGVKPLLIDIGAQAISGSTRLQSASIAKLCLGSCLYKVFFQLSLLSERITTPFHSYQISHNLLPKYFNEIIKLIELELKVFQSPYANFHRICDETDKGYVTFICSKNAIREVMFDCVEMSPTFSLSTPCSLHETEKKLAEFRAYVLSCSNIDNRGAWENLLERPLFEDEHNVEEFLINNEAVGNGSYQKRPKGKGNLLIGVLMETLNPKEMQILSYELTEAAQQGGKTGVIAILSSKAPNALIELAKSCDASLIIDQIEGDFFGISETLILKEVLNLISNSSMIAMDKIHGNTMIDLAPSNNKLIERSVRIIREIYAKRHPNQPFLDEELIYHMVIRGFFYKKLIESQHKIYIPSPIRIILEMIEKKYPINKAIKNLQPYYL